MEQWTNVEMSNLSKKSYTLNNDFSLGKKNSIDNGQNAGGTYRPTDNNDDKVDNANSSEVLQPGSDIKPKVNQEDVESLVRRLYGITINDIKEMLSYDDRNYLITEDPNIKNPIIVSHWPHGYILKILNALDSKKTDFIDAQNKLMINLSIQKIQCPRPISNVNGKHFSVEHINGANYVVRLLEFIPGKIFHEVEKTNYLLFQTGEYLARIDRGLKNFTHEAYETHKTLWMLQSVPQLREFIYVLEDHAKKEMIEEIITAFEKEVLTKLDTFETQVIHGDFNEHNIIVDKKPNESEYKVVAVIDFGDTNKSPIIFEVGISLTYMMLQTKSLESGGIFIAGYISERPINNDEKPFLKYCVAARLAQSLVMGLYTNSVDPSNEYVLVTQEQGWKLIEQLWRENFAEIDEIWQTAADKYLTQSCK